MALCTNTISSMVFDARPWLLLETRLVFESDWVCRVSRPTRHIIGHFGDDFYIPDDQTNSVKALKETSWSSRSGLNPTSTTPASYQRKYGKLKPLWHKFRSHHKLTQLCSNTRTVQSDARFGRTSIFTQPPPRIQLLRAQTQVLVASQSGSVQKSSTILSEWVSV